MATTRKSWVLFHPSNNRKGGFMNAEIFSRLLIVGFIAAAFAPLNTARATQIQMLPPTDFSENPCGALTGGILQWDGSTSIKCVPGASGDSNGNVALNGTIRPGSNGIQVGQSCATEGALGYDLISAAHQPCYCSTNRVWTAIGQIQGYQVITEVVQNLPGAEYGITCPNGKKVLSGTCLILDGTQGEPYFLQNTSVSGDGSEFQCMYDQSNGNQPPISIQTQVICAYASD
jgi:hypothetical protein